MTTVPHREADISDPAPPVPPDPPTPPVPPVPQRHPFGVRVIITLFLMKSLLMIMVVVAFAIDLGMQYRGLELAQSIAVQMPTTSLSFVLLIPLNIMAAYGLWRRKGWAWVLTMVLLAYAMIIDIVNFFGGQPIYVAMLLNVIQVGYLNQREVQALFTTPDHYTPDKTVTP